MLLSSSLMVIGKKVIDKTMAFEHIENRFLRLTDWQMNDECNIGLRFLGTSRQSEQIKIGKVGYGIMQTWDSRDGVSHLACPTYSIPTSLLYVQVTNVHVSSKQTSKKSHPASNVASKFHCK